MASPLRITLNGSLGSGKSTVGRMLSQKLGVQFISTGSIFRELGKVSNLDALQTNLAAEDNTSLDDKVDGYIQKLAATGESFIIDSRMAWHFVPNSLDVYLFAHPSTAIRRIMSDPSRDTEKYRDAADADEKLAQRRLSEKRRYKRLYGVDIDDPQNFSLFVTTDDAEPAEIAAVIAERLADEGVASSWISKSWIVPLMRAPSGAVLPSSEPAHRPLALHFENGFGYAFEDAAAVASALRSGSSIVPFREQIPPRMDAGTDFLAFTRKNSTAAHFVAWSLAGDIQLKIAEFLPEH